MPELQQAIKRQQKYLLYLLASFVLGWGVTSTPTIYAGLILGTALSLYNHWIISKRIIRLGKAVDEGAGKYRLLERFCEWAQRLSRQ